MNTESIKVIPHLDRKGARKCEHSTLNVARGAEWLLEPTDPTGERWIPYRLCYTKNNDAEEWIPLSGWYLTIHEAQAAVKAFLATVQPVFLDSKGDVTNEYYA